MLQQSDKLNKTAFNAGELVVVDDICFAGEGGGVRNFDT